VKIYIKKKESGTAGGNAGEGKYLTRARAVKYLFLTSMLPDPSSSHFDPAMGRGITLIP
jgi:hypothetical protein